MFNPAGRISRQRYWGVGIPLSILSICLAILLIVALPLIALTNFFSPPLGTFILIAGYALSIPIAYVNIVLHIRRFHDRDKSGWWVLVGFIPIIGPLWLLVECGFLRGTVGANRFGEDPVISDRMDPVFKWTLIGFGAIIVILIVWRLLWAYTQVKNDQARYTSQATTSPEGTINLSLEPTVSWDGLDDSNTITPLAQPTTAGSSPVTITDVSTNVSQVNCDDNWQCLILAASQCRPATGTINYNNLPTPPFGEVLLTSGRTKYEVKKSGNSCTLVYSMISASFALSAEGRSMAVAQGLTDAEIDDQVKAMNDSTNDAIGRLVTCTASGNVIASYLSDTKNGIRGEVTWIMDFTPGSVMQSRVTTSSGEDFICSHSSPLE